MKDNGPANVCTLSHANDVSMSGESGEVVKASIKMLIERLNDRDPNLLEKYPLADFVKLMEDASHRRGYQEISGPIRKVSKEIARFAGESTLELYNRAVLLMLVCAMPEKIEVEKYTEQVRSLFITEMQRIVSELDSNKPGFYSFDNDLFCKDLAISTLRMFSVGVLKVEGHAGIPRRFLAVGGIRQLLRGARVIGLLKGFYPYYEIHLDIRYRADFNPAGWDRALLNTAEMLKLHEQIKGMIGASWFFDPQIPYVSPHLTYLRQHIEENGGEFFYMKRDARTTHLAISASSTRKKLYECGKYVPCSYMAIWPRGKMLQWAEREKSTRITLPSGEIG